MAEHLDPEKLKILYRIASRLLNLSAGTNVTELRKSLERRRSLVDEMVTANLLRLVKGYYVPTFSGIEQLDVDIRKLVRGNVNCVLAALNRLYKRTSDSYTFSFGEIVQETKTIDPTRDGNDVLPTLILSEEFGYYAFPHGIGDNDGHLQVDSVTVFEWIMDFTSVEDYLARIIAEREERNRATKVNAPTTALAPSVGTVSALSFGFM